MPFGSLRTFAGRIGDACGAVTLAAAGYLVVYLIWAVWARGRLRSSVSSSRRSPSFPLDLAAAVVCWMAAARAKLDPQTRRAWRLVALALLLNWSVSCLVIYHNRVLGVEPGFGAPDIVNLLVYPTMLWGLLSFPIAPRTASERTRFWLDTGTVMLSGTMVVWYFVLRPIALDTTSGLLDIATAVAYPIGDLVLLFGSMAVLLRRPEETSRRALAFVAVGLLTFFLSDLVDSYLSLDGTADDRRWLSAMWIARDVFIIAGAQVFRRGARSAAAPAPYQTAPFSLAPYAALVDRLRPAHWRRSRRLGRAPRRPRPRRGRAHGRSRFSVRLPPFESGTGRNGPHARTEERFVALVRHASDLIVVLEPDSTVRYVSPSIERLLGYEPAGIVGTALLELVHPDDAPRAGASSSPRRLNARG